MPVTRFENLPGVRKSVRTRSLFVMHLKVRPLVVVGATPGSTVASVWYRAARLRETVCPGSNARCIDHYFPLKLTHSRAVY